MKNFGSNLQNRRKDQSATALGQAVGQLMDSRIAPNCQKYGAIAQCWAELLPAELAAHSRIADFSSGELKVAVDSSSHLYEMRLCANELLEVLQRNCPQAKIRQIKFIIG